MNGIGSLALQWGPTAALIAAGGYLLSFVQVARKRGLPAATERWFAGYLVLSAIWTVAWALAHLWRWLQPGLVDLGGSLAVYTSALLPPAVAVVTLHFLSRRHVREVVSLGLIWAAAVVLLERGIVHVSATKTALDALRVVGWTGFILGSIALTAYEYVGLRRPLHRNRVLYWLVALLLVGLGEGLQQLSSANMAALGLPLRLLGAMMMTYAITTYALPDLKSVGRRIVLLVVVTLVRASLYLVAIVGAVVVYQLLRRASLDEVQLLWLAISGGVVGALLLAVMQAPIQHAVAGMAERLLFGPGYDASRALRDYSQNISNILHIEHLAGAAIEAIAGVLEVGRGALLAITERDDGGADVRVISGMGDVPAMSAAFAPESPVLRTLCETSRPLTQYDIDMLPQFRAMDAQERQWQWALDVEVYVPIHSRRTLIGALALGAKHAGEPYSAQDLVVLSTLAGQTAVALENARLFDDQRRLNQEVSLLNQELIAANAQLERIDRAKTDFLNIASHELRTPLTQVRGYADMLGEMMAEGTIDSSNAQKMLASIRKATERLEGLYSAMLDASAIGVDGLQLHLEQVRPAFFIEQATRRWQDALQQRQQTLLTTGIGELPPVEGDQERLAQAFSNLINNAIKFTPDGGVIEVKGWVVEGAEPAVEIVVADTGVGIDPQDHDLIFEKFHHVGSADLHSTDDIRFKAGGPGLGLTIARGIIEGHGGRIWAESERHDEELLPGSRFHVLLPMRSTLAHATAESEPTKKPRPIAELARRLASRAEPKGSQELR